MSLKIFSHSIFRKSVGEVVLAINEHYFNCAVIDIISQKMGLDINVLSTAPAVVLSQKNRALIIYMYVDRILDMHTKKPSILLMYRTSTHNSLSATYSASVLLRPVVFCPRLFHTTRLP